MKRNVLTFKKNFYEQQAWEQNNLVLGIDEVGRGCLAGPLVTAAVILPVNTAYRNLKDSKIMTEQERLTAYTWLVKHSKFTIGIVHNRIIETQNIWQATLIAMKKALLHLLTTCGKNPTAILVDAMPVELLDTSFNTIPIHSFIKGESKSSSIAAASIIAKVTRDNIMKQFNTILPGYAFDEHKGYSTQKHKQAVTLYGPCIIHRTTFLSRTTLPNQDKDEYEKQQLLC